MPSPRDSPVTRGAADIKPAERPSVSRSRRPCPRRPVTAPAVFANPPARISNYFGRVEFGEGRESTFVVVLTRYNEIDYLE
jgi:hypothetical protein